MRALHRGGAVVFAFALGAVACISASNDGREATGDPIAGDRRLDLRLSMDAGGQSDDSGASCAANYTSAGFPKVYRGSPSYCLGCPSVDEYCATAAPGTGVTLCYDTMPCTTMGGGTPYPCPCTRSDAGPPCIGARCMDAGPDAGMCMQGEPTYPPKTEDQWSVGVGFEFPDGAATAVCAFMSKIPYVGPVLFNGDGVSISGTYTSKKTDEWIPTCHHETSSSGTIKPMALVCGLQLDGQLTLTDVDTKSHCVDCGPPAACGDLSCSKHTDLTSVDVNISKVWDIGLGGDNGTCPIRPQKKSWKQWLLSNTTLTVRAGAGAGGSKSKTVQTAGAATSCPNCTNCTSTDFDGHVNLSAGARAELSTPSWIGVSGSAWVDLSGQARGGYKGTTSTCAPFCGGPYVRASATLELGLRAQAWFVSYNGAWRWTCVLNKSFSTCPGSAKEDKAYCGWSEPGDP